MVRVFVPASVGNVGPGFDTLGMAITGPGDTVEAEWSTTPGVTIDYIDGDGSSSLPLDPDKNTAGIAAREVLLLARETRGVTLTIHKGVPGTGLGSSAASAVAGAFAVNSLLDHPFPKEDLLPACIEGESYVSGGVFLDNLGASLFGGVVTCHTNMEKVWKVGTIDSLQVIVATPDVPVLTRNARRLLDRVPMSGFVHNMASACAMVAAVAREDAISFGSAIDDQVIEPQRSRLIKGFDQVKSAAIGAGALGCSISGAGASVFAVAERPEQAELIGHAMATAFAGSNMSCTVTLAEMDGEGARILGS